MTFMPETKRKTLEQVVDDDGRYPVAAFEFVRLGLNYAVEQIHGNTSAEDSHHVTGKQLSLALRDFAIMRYGCMAAAVLGHWGIRSTMDFGNIVFVMVQNRILQKTEQDDVRDFENVFPFQRAFEAPARPATPRCEPTFCL
jgi:uncharacterized repeat protein (TIGR04138 family)